MREPEYVLKKFMVEISVKRVNPADESACLLYR